MKISIACDHGAFDLKERLKAHLLEQGHQVTDCGAHSTESCDYPDFAAAAARLVADGICERGWCCAPPASACPSPPTR